MFMNVEFNFRLYLSFFLNFCVMLWVVNNKVYFFFCILIYMDVLVNVNFSI